MVLLKTHLGPHRSCPLGSLCPSRHVIGPTRLPCLIRCDGLRLLLLKICRFWFLYLLTFCDTHASPSGHLDSIAHSTGGENLSSLCLGQTLSPQFQHLSLGMSHGMSDIITGM